MKEKIKITREELLEILGVTQRSASPFTFSSCNFPPIVLSLAMTLQKDVWLSVDFGTGANQVANGNHTHSNYLGKKLTALNRVVVTDGDGNITTNTITTTKLGYLSNMATAASIVDNALLFIFFRLAILISFIYRIFI